MPDNDDAARLKQLATQIAAAREHLAQLRAERDDVLERIRENRARRLDPLHDLEVTIVFGADGDGIPLADGPTRAIAVPD